MTPLAATSAASAETSVSTLIGTPATPGNTTPGAAAPPRTANSGDKWQSPADGMTLVYVPAGSFLMGSTDAQIAQVLQMCPTCQASQFSNEKPQHSVNLDAYWIDQTEVTNAMYAACAQAGKCPAPSDSSSRTHPTYFGNTQYDHYPVIFVTWDDAQAYCAWAGRRLPTEAEWEMAARGTDGRLFPWGNQAASPTLANYANNVGDTTETGKYPAGASPYGALDMAGNVAEWVNDRFAGNYYASAPADNPPGPSTGSNRVLRGGSWNSSLLNMVTTVRAYGPQSLTHNTIGFRCAASP